MWHALGIGARQPCDAPLSSSCCSWLELCFVIPRLRACAENDDADQQLISGWVVVLLPHHLISDVLLSWPSRSRYSVVNMHPCNHRSEAKCTAYTAALFVLFIQRVVGYQTKREFLCALTLKLLRSTCLYVSFYFVELLATVDRMMRLINWHP